MSLEVKRLLDARNHFEVLNLVFESGRLVSAKDVKKQFKKLALLVHPDKCISEPHAAEAFKRLSAASECLSDVSKQESYIREKMGVSSFYYAAPVPRESSGQRAEKPPKPRTRAEKEARKQAKREQQARRERERQEANEARERWAEQERERLRQRMEQMPETFEANANAWRRFTKVGKRATAETKFHTKTSPFGEHWGEFDADHTAPTPEASAGAAKRKSPSSSAPELSPDDVQRRAACWSQFMHGKWSPKPADDCKRPPGHSHSGRQRHNDAGCQQRPVDVDADEDHDSSDDFDTSFAADSVQRPTVPKDPVVDGEENPGSATLGLTTGKKAIGCYTCLTWFPTGEALLFHEQHSQYHAFNSARLHDFRFT
eukprot:TRINITY_DN7183_c0_g1_i1.p1 TRINITY_DN7183_c0_g1~~TRINITY_DN7183_c0_g1_i1.p1  ORF type:complete len:372 (+),score=44.25 TRINITY_DN7183_c0_g1_i1:958-2073(+)